MRDDLIRSFKCETTKNVKVPLLFLLIMCGMNGWISSWSGRRLKSLVKMAESHISKKLTWNLGHPSFHLAEWPKSSRKALRDRLSIELRLLRKTKSLPSKFKESCEFSYLHCNDASDKKNCNGNQSSRVSSDCSRVFLNGRVRWTLAFKRSIDYQDICP